MRLVVEFSGDKLLDRQYSSNLSTLVAGIIAALIVFLGFNSFVIVNPGQAGVLSILGKAQDGALLEGIVRFVR